MKQAIRVGKIVTCSKETQMSILSEVGKMIETISLESTPPEIALQVYKKINQITGISDPFYDIKQANIKQVLKIVPLLKNIIQESNDRLFAAVKLAIAGNIIDLGTGESFNLKRDILDIQKYPLQINHYEAFKKKLQNAKNILYLGDNSSEAIFDRLLIEELNKNVTFVVREQPIINDITLKESKIIGMGNVARVISSGTGAPGTVLRTCSKKFLEIMEKADFIISKGQGNFEALSQTHYPIFFLLKAKCSVIAKDIGVKLGSFLLMENKKW